MRTHTSDFKNGLKQYGKQFSDTLYYSANGSTTSYGQDDINRFDYSVDAQLLKSVMQTIKVDSNISFNLDNKLQYDISLDGVNNSTIHFKNFNIIKKEDQKDKKSYLYTCQDNMIKAMVDYETPVVNNTAITYPITVRNYLSAICSHLGLTFKNASSTFTNYDKNITSEHYVDVDGNSLGYTFRDVLDDLAEATGSFICIDDNGQLEVRGFTNTNDTIDEEYFDEKNVTIGKKVGPYNVVVLSREDVDNLYYPSTLPASPYELKIVDNPILEQDNREDFIQGIYNNINGLEFYLNDVTTKGILYYEVGDKYNISIGGVIYPCLMLSDNIKRTTGLKEIITTTEPKLSVTDYKYASSSDKVEIQSRNAYIKANKAEGTAEMIVQGIGSGGQVTGASVIASINNDSSNLKLEADKIDINGVVSANNNFKIKTDGSVEINNGTLDLVDNGTSETIPKIKVASRDNVVTNEIYSYGMEINNTNGTKIEVSTGTTDNIYIEYKHSDNSKEKVSLSSGALWQRYEDTNGNITRWATLYPGDNNDSAFTLGTGSSTNFEIHNEQNNTYTKVKGSLVATDNNGNDKFVVDGSTGNATIGGTLYTSNNGRVDYADFGFYYDGAGNMTHKRNNPYDNFTINDSSGNNKIQIYPESGDVKIISNGTNSNVMFMHSGIPSTDLNDIKYYGSYNYDNGSHGYTNCPTSDGIHILNVFNNGSTDWVVQEDYVLRWNASSVEKYIRMYSPPGWSNWQRII